MRIFIDGLAALQGGGVTYLNEILRQFSTYDNLEVHVYGFTKKNETYFLDSKNVKFHKVYFDSSNKFVRTLVGFVYFGILLRIKNYDIAFFPNGTLSALVPKKTKSVTMFRNMLPFSQRNIDKFFKLSVRLRYYILRMIYVKSYKEVDHVIFISDYGYQTVKSFITEIDAKSSIIPHGINEHFRFKKEICNEGYLLYVSILNEYKHQIEIVKGLSLFRQKYGHCPKVVFAGYINPDYLRRLRKEIECAQLEENVEILGPVSHEKLPELYRQAKIVIFGSTCENCPNILLESMASNNPIICSNHPPMPEFLKDGGFYFDPESPDSFENSLAMYIDDLKSLKDFADKAYRYCSDYTWENAAYKTIGTFSKLVKS